MDIGKCVPCSYIRLCEQHQGGYLGRKMLMIEHYRGVKEIGLEHWTHVFMGIGGPWKMEGGSCWVSEQVISSDKHHLLALAPLNNIIR